MIKTLKNLNTKIKIKISVMFTYSELEDVPLKFVKISNLGTCTKGKKYVGIKFRKFK